jgi:hypothetical protein
VANKFMSHRLTSSTDFLQRVGEDAQGLVHPVRFE